MFNRMRTVVICDRGLIRREHRKTFCGDGNMYFAWVVAADTSKLRVL